ncbi:hypothetical protein T459_22847 [Capsicum annuum]|uniref:Uncharacterized protein n=1 Tax=Capsicum annuum TaxID=4072 RepID=A0A2G2YQN3_CAPAN|nr:hypothetical protein T459_22847 [Capsicum annuum]
MSPMKTITNMSKYCLNTQFIKYIKAVGELMVVFTHFERTIFLCMNKTGVSYREMLGLMNPSSKRSFNCSFNSLSFTEAILYGGIDMGKVFGIWSIPKSISLMGGTPGRSSKNTSENSFTTGTDSRLGVSKLEFLTSTR